MKLYKYAGMFAAFLVLIASSLNFPVAWGEAVTRIAQSEAVSLWADENLVAWCVKPSESATSGTPSSMLLPVSQTPRSTYVALTTGTMRGPAAAFSDQKRSGVTEYLPGSHSLLLVGFSTHRLAAEQCPKPSKSAPPVSLLIVTGGHLYEPSEFFAAFNAMPNIRYQHVLMVEGKPVAVPVGGLGQYDVVLFYDMEPKTITPEWRSLLERGKGFVFLHHALGSFPESPEFKAIVGGHANFSEGPQPGVPSSSYHENEPQHYSIIDHQHPVTCGISDFDMTDEAYDNIDVDPAAHVLMKSDFPKLSHDVAWTWSYAGKRVLYLEPGHGSFELPPNHGPTAYQNESFRKVLNRGILWAAGRL
jgi:uncharacterized protein